jgi:hypothetical protein
MQVPSCFLSKIPVSNTEGRYNRVLPKTNPPIGAVEGASGNTGTEYTGRSGTQGGVDRAEVFGFRGGRVYKGKVGDPTVRKIRIDG